MVFGLLSSPCASVDLAALKGTVLSTFFAVARCRGKGTRKLGLAPKYRYIRR